MPRIPVIGHLLGVVDLVVVLRVVLAAYTDAVSVAYSPLRKALAVEFQTIDFGTLTSRVVMLLLLLFELRQGGVGRWGPPLPFLEQFLKEILGPAGGYILLIYEFERKVKRRSIFLRIFLVHHTF